VPGSRPRMVQELASLVSDVETKAQSRFLNFGCWLGDGDAWSDECGLLGQFFNRDSLGLNTLDTGKLHFVTGWEARMRQPLGTALRAPAPNDGASQQAPVGQSYAPGGQGYALLAQGYALLAQGYAPVGQGYAPVGQGYAPVGQGYAPVGQGYAPVGQG